MTGQVDDSICYNGEYYSISAKKGGDLFTPESMGIETEGISSACWHGYACSYSIRDNGLYLDSLEIGFAPGHEVAEIFGIKLEKLKDKFSFCGDHFAENINHLMPFTGSLLIARDFIQGMYEHMGFQPPYRYRNVIELSFDDGKLHEANDRSSEVNVYRQWSSRRFKRLFRSREEISVSDWMDSFK